MSQVVCSYCGKTWDSSVGPFCPDDGTYLPFSEETDESAEIAEETLRRPDEPATEEIEPTPPSLQPNGQAVPTDDGLGAQSCPLNAGTIATDTYHVVYIANERFCREAIAPLDSRLK